MLSRFFAQRVQAWLRRRLPPTKQVTLNQRRIFIFPSRAGFGFLLLLAVLLLAAINYQNNMIFALVFLLASVFVVAILHSFANLSGLRIELQQACSGFVGDRLGVTIKLIAPSSRRSYFDIALTSTDMEPLLVSLQQQAALEQTLYWRAQRRGVFRPPRLLLESHYPLGLLRSWSWLWLDTECLVYPRPLSGNYHHDEGAGDELDGQLQQQGSSEFYGLRDYIAGDSPRHIAWQAYAKGLGLFSKQFVDYYHQPQLLCWQGVTGSVEQRLSVLCYWVLQLEAQQQPYGLQLPGTTIAPALGRAHQQQALRALALFAEGG